MADRVWEDAERGFQAVEWGLEQLAEVLFRLERRYDSDAMGKAARRVKWELKPLFTTIMDEAFVAREKE